MTAISIPRFEYINRFHLEEVGIGYMCNQCQKPVFLRFPVRWNSGKVVLPTDNYQEVEFPKETFELHYLPGEVASDFEEALTCYSNQCFNAFAAMCRRTAQSAFTELGAEGKSRVTKQFNEVKELVEIDEETKAMLDQIILSGHDGAHPNLPKLNKERAVILLEMMKDTLHQLFIRAAKIREAAELRQQAISEINDK